MGKIRLVTKTQEEEKMKIIVNGYAYPSTEPAALYAWMRDLTMIGNFSYGMMPDGSLIDLNDENLIEAAENSGVQPLMVLTPMNESGQYSSALAHQVLSDEAAQENLLNNILAMIEEKGLFGVDFDWEYVYAEDAKPYAALVQRAALLLNPLNYLVTAALAPKVSADQPGLLYQGHDYEAMGEAANLILIMTYEWGYTFGPPMAVAPIDSVRKVLDYAVTAIPPEKILMGMPNYGYDWPLPYEQGTTRAERISNDEAVSRADRYGAEIRYDQTAQAAYYYYWECGGAPVDSGDDCCRCLLRNGGAWDGIGEAPEPDTMDCCLDEDGKPMYPVRHVVWFDNAESWAARLALVEEYNLAGIAFWDIRSFYTAGSLVLNELYEVLKV